MLLQVCIIQDLFRAIPFENLSGGMEKKYVGGVVREKLKYEGGRQKIKYVWGVGKIFHSAPPPRRVSKKKPRS